MWVARARDAQPRKTAAAHDTPEDASLSSPMGLVAGPGQRVWDSFKDGAADLVRVRRIDHPRGRPAGPEQGYFLRENLKLQLLNARLALLSRQWESARPT
jgi:uroporphyrin-3 C-methyltransferase